MPRILVPLVASLWAGVTLAVPLQTIPGSETAAAGGSGRVRGPGAPPHRAFNGIVVDPDTAGGAPTLYEYRFHPDSGLVVRSLGRADVEAGLFTGIPALPPGGGPELRIPADTYIGIAEMVRTMTGDDSPPDEWGVSVVDGRVRFSLSRGVSFVAAAVFIVGALAALALVFTLLHLRRERGRRAALTGAARRQLEAREAERVRIAREIHDGPIQDLHAIRASISGRPTTWPPSVGDNDRPSGSGGGET